MSVQRIKKSKILEAAQLHPEARPTLETLFPELFENEKPFIKVGSIFLRKGYPDNMYMVAARKSGQVIVFNMTYGSVWEPKVDLVINAPFKNDKITHKDNIWLSREAFTKLTGYTDLSQFVVIGDPQDLWTLLKLAKL